MNNCNRAGFRFEPEKEIQYEKEDKTDLHSQPNPNHMQNLHWCACTNCCIMKSNIENICCCKLPVLKEKIGVHKCITSSSSFAKLCLDVEVLEILMTALKDFVGESIDNKLSNRTYRFSSYRSYIYWVYGKLGRNKRKVIPACVVLAIRNCFPEANAVYEAFHDFSPSASVASVSLE